MPGPRMAQTIQQKAELGTPRTRSQLVIAATMTMPQTKPR